MTEVSIAENTVCAIRVVTSKIIAVVLGERKIGIMVYFFCASYVHHCQQLISIQWLTICAASESSLDTRFESLETSPSHVSFC